MQDLKSPVVSLLKRITMKPEVSENTVNNNSMLSMQVFQSYQELISESINLSSGKDYMLEIAKGNIAGHSIKNKYGRNPDVTTATFSTIWNGGGHYTGHDAIAAETVTIVSAEQPIVVALDDNPVVAACNSIQ